MIRVLLVDDQHLIRAGLRMLCEAQPDIEVVGEADNGRDAIALAARLVPDVVVMDLRMPGVDGISATSRILADRPGARVLVLTTFGDDDHLYPALTAAPAASCSRRAADRAARRCAPRRDRRQPVQLGGAAPAGAARGARAAPGRRRRSPG